jgi:aminoglycoside phosphotransferase (APT) family kinase protein
VSSHRAEQRPSSEALEVLLARVFPSLQVVATEPLAEGFSNFTYKVVFANGEPVVLRIFGRDPAACLKEVDLLRLVGASIPVPEVVDAYPNGLGDIGPFLVMRFVEGITFLRLRATRDTEAIAEAAGSIGETLAAIGRYAFEHRGRLGAGLSVDGPFLNGPNAVPEFVESCLASPALRSRLDAPTCRGVRQAVWSRAADLGRLEDERRLMHRDFNNRNVVVRRVGGRWQVAAVLDWEFAVSGSPLVDVGSFLRYETATNPSREPHFSRGYERGGGHLPRDWRELARLVDVASLCELLTKPGVPDEIVVEVCDLVRRTVRQRPRRAVPLRYPDP